MFDSQFVEQFADAVAQRVVAQLGGVQAKSIRLMSVEQAAAYIARTPQAVRHLIHQRDIPVIRTGRNVRIDRNDLDIWIENNRG